VISDPLITSISCSFSGHGEEEREREREMGSHAVMEEWNGYREGKKAR
jgi:hypothetical protein